MERRQHDIFMDMASNPGATFDNLVVAGLTAQNTSLQDKSVYENNEWVREQFKDLYGEFDKQSFNVFYNNAKAYYNSLASANFDESMHRQVTYHRDNIFAPVDKIREGPDFTEIRMANPFLTTSSVIELGKVGPRTKSIDELAQANKVLLNPATAGPNLENAKWGDAPNDNFWGYFFDTLVQAQWDTDGTHVDPFTGKEVQHKAGEFKLDNDGNFYYEKLDGRDVYGRRVLNKMNVLTTDGSWANKFDFFDSDDIEQKSIGGTVLKNLALVGSMFIPYVGPWITGLSIATQLAGLGATLGKMSAGSDLATLSEIEGWAKSVSRQGAQTEYAQENTWCWENFINLIGDVAGQLKEQRFIFEKVPAVFKGSNMMSKEGQLAKLKQFEKKRIELANTKIEELRRAGTNAAELSAAEANLRTAAALRAQADLDSFIKGYNNLGEILSKGYMTAVTVGDTYGEAKMAGASDVDATLLTLGYAAGEYALLSTGLGEWILPELRAGRYKSQAIARALTQQSSETQSLWKQFGAGLKNMPKEGKREYAKRLFNLGRDIARAEYANGTRTLAATAASAAGEGFEEVSEELLADFSKGCYDVVKWLQGEDTRINTFGYDFEKGDWNSSEILDRYGMSLIGGAIGGGLTNVATNYKMINSFNNMTSEQAIQELVYMARNGGTLDFLKQVSRMQLGDPNLSTDYVVDGTNLVFQPGTKENNQDVYIKKAIVNLIKMIESILQANGAVSDSKFLDAQTLGDLRFNALHKSTTAGAYLQEYNSLNSDIVRITNQINEVVNSAIDTNGDEVITDREQRKAKLSTEKLEAVKKLEDELKEKKKALEDLISGKRAYEFIATSLFEMTTALSGRFTTVTFPLYAEKKFGKKYSELTDVEREVARQAYEQWKTTEGRERLRTLSAVYRQVAELASQVIKNHEQTYLQTSSELSEVDKAVAGLYNYVSGVDEASWLEGAQSATDASLANLGTRLVQILGTEQDAAELKAILERGDGIDRDAPQDERARQMEEISRDYKNKLEEILLANIRQYVAPFIEKGFANTETKNQLERLLLAAENIAKRKQAEWEMWAEENYDPFSLEQPINPYSSTVISLVNAVKEVRNLASTPIEQNLDEFSISIGNAPINLTQLIQRLNASFNDVQDDVTKFTLDQQLYKDLNNAIYTLQLYQAAILGARTDAVNLGNLFGYNATLNEVAEKIEGMQAPQLAEIDSQTADVFVEDINANLNKLQFLKQLYEINQGQKLSRQDRVSTRKDLLIYKRLKHIVSVLDDDELKTWDGFLELQNAINGMTIHEQLLRSGETNVSNDLREAFETEKLAAENAIYDFFQREGNRARLENPAELAKFINPSRLQLYTEATELLNEGLENLDDNSLVWWLASRVAVRSSDFYSQYRQIIDPDAEKPLAPISTQELAIYNNYASIVNGNVFTAFYNAYRHAIVNDWKRKTVDERKEVLARMGKETGLASDELADYSINFLSAPRYSNIVLTEGIPGSGKSTGVFQSTLKLLRQFHPELLKNVAVVHGANADSAVKLRDDIGLTSDNSSTYGRELFMKEVNPSWTEYAKDPNTGAYQVPLNHFTVTDEKEIRSSLGIKETTTPPNLIIIDEISKFSAYDLDLIDKFARKYGISILVAGDFDQSGVTGQHGITIAGKSMQWNMELSRVNFIRSPKLGVSMRTDNSLKTVNLQKLQAYMQNPNGSIEFNYFQDETGLFGDKVHLYSNENHESDKKELLDDVLKDVDLLISTLKEGEKIGYIYSSKASPIYQALTQDKYKPYIDFREGGSAQGLEGQYYIIEANPTTSQRDYLKDIYTGMSRAQQGSIIVAPVENEGIKFGSMLISEKVNEGLSNSTIASFARKRKALLDAVASDGNKVEIIPRVTTKSVDAPPVKPGLPPAVDPTPPPVEIPPIKPALPPAIDPTPPPVEDPVGPPAPTPPPVVPPVPPKGSEDPVTKYKTGDVIEIYTSDGKKQDDMVYTVAGVTTNKYGTKYNLVNTKDGSKLTLDTTNVDSDDVKYRPVRTAPTTDPIILSREEIEERFGERTKISDFTVTVDGNEIQLFLEQIPFINARDEAGNVNMINYNHRNIVVVNIGGFHMPFYMTTGKGGKVETIDGEWYPFFGIGPGGWLNKTNGLDMSRYYDSPILEAISKKLNELLGVGYLDDIAGPITLDTLKDGSIPPQIEFINLDLHPVANHTEQTPTLVAQAIEEVKATVDKKVEELKKPHPVEQPHVEPLIYEDDIAPITQTDIISEAEYRAQIDSASENAELPQSAAEAKGDAIAIDMLLHSFNTFEVGVLTDEHGMPVPVGSQAWMDARIDSVNGLIKVDKLLGNPIKTTAEYIQQIGRLRSILFNTKDKAKLCERLQDFLGIKGIYCTFALKSSPTSGKQNRESGREFVGNSPNPFEKGISEHTVFNGSADERSNEWHPKSIVAIIGTDSSGNLLELPLIALSSPFTLIQVKDNNGKQVFALMNARYLSLLSEGLDLHAISEALILEFEGASQFKELVDLFKLYNFIDGGVFYIDDTQWTPSNNLQLLGPQFVTDRGYYQLASGLFMNDTTNPEAEWITLSDLSKNPQTSMTKKVLISMTGYIDGVDHQVVNAGHPFVLISYNRDLNTDKKIIDQYIQQEKDPTRRKEVKLMYVLPPKAPIRDYLGNLKKILTKLPDVLYIGNLFTSYKLLKTLLQNQAFRDTLERKVKGLVTKLDEAVREIDSLSSVTEQKDKLYEVKTWIEQGFPAAKLAGLFDSAIVNVAYNRNSLSNADGKGEVIYTVDEAGISLIEQALASAGIDRVYYKVKLPRDAAMNGPFREPLLDAGYTVNGLPFRIHGKIDSYTFKGNMSWLVNSALSKLRPSPSGHRWSIDSPSYWDWKTRSIGNSNITKKPQPIRETEEQRKVRNIAEYVKRKTGMDISGRYGEGKTIQQVNQEVVKEINASNNNLVAFQLGDEIRISSSSNYLSGTVYVYDQSGNPISDISSFADNNGIYLFVIITDLSGEITQYQASYNSSTLEMILLQQIEQKSGTVSLSVTAENIQEYLESGREVLEAIFDFDPSLSEAFGMTTYEEFVQALSNMEYIGDDRISDLEGQLEGATPLQVQIINDLINLERSHDPDKQDVNDENLICPQNIKIKF